MKISYSISFFILLYGHIPGLMALSDTDGFIYTYGDAAPAMQSVSMPTFVWDGSGSRLYAGVGTPALSSLGEYSFSFGYSSATGDYSLAFGEYAFADSDRSLAFGYYASIYGPDSFALGDYAQVNQEHGVAIGNGPLVNSTGGVAIGYYPYAEGTHSVSIGYSNSSSGTGSVAIGYDTTASAIFAFSSGYQSESMGIASTAMGYMNSVTGGYGSVSMGHLNEVSNDSGTSFALGRALKVATGGESVFVTGQSNARASGIAGDPGGNYLFVIGNGEPGVYRSDAFAVDTYGNVWASGTFSSAAGTNYFQGNVGIGTSSPAAEYKVEVVGGSSTAQTKLLQIRSNGNGNNTASTLRFANNTSATEVQGSAEISAIRTNSGMTGATDMVFRVSSGSTVAERMRITSAGNVRIGSGSLTSGYKLDVGGPLQVDGDADVQANLTVGGNFLVTGTVIIERQGDIPMGIYE